MQRGHGRPDSRLKYIPDTAHRILSGSYGVRAEKEIGHGYAGTVVRCSMLEPKHPLCPTELVAAKVMLKAKIKAKSAENEVRLLRHAKSQNVLHFITAVESLDAFIIMTEFCGKGDLHGLLGKLDNANVMAREYLLGVTVGLQTLHSKFIAHCDIKMKNILITDNNTAKIADFGFAMKFPSSESRSTVCHGTKDYWAPEMCHQWPEFDPFKADIYALGVTFVGVCERKPIKKSCDNIHKIVKSFKDHDQRELFQGMLSIKPVDRFSLNDITENSWILACMTPPPSPPSP